MRRVIRARVVGAAAAAIGVIAAAGAAIAEPAGKGGQAPSPLPAKEGFGWPKGVPKPTRPDCKCRHKEGRAEIGETVCLNRGNRRVLARCAWSQNVPYWQILGPDCDVTS